MEWWMNLEFLVVCYEGRSGKSSGHDKRNIVAEDNRRKDWHVNTELAVDNEQCSKHLRCDPYLRDSRDTTYGNTANFRVTEKVVTTEKGNLSPWSGIVPG